MNLIITKNSSKSNIFILSIEQDIKINLKLEGEYFKRLKAWKKLMLKGVKRDSSLNNVLVY